jgi:hypothetical protein
MEHLFSTRQQLCEEIHFHVRDLIIYDSCPERVHTRGLQASLDNVLRFVSKAQDYMEMSLYFLNFLWPYKKCFTFIVITSTRSSTKDDTVLD